MIFLSERFGIRAIGRHAGREADSHSAAGWQPDPLTEADDRIEHHPGGSRQRASIERQWVSRAAATPEETRAIGLPFDRTLCATFQAEGMERPRRRLARLSRPPMAE